MIIAFIYIQIHISIFSNKYTIQNIFSEISSETKYYGVKILKTLSKEIIGQYDSSEEFLNYQIGKRYFNEVSLFLLYAINERLTREGTANVKLLQDYSLMVLDKLKEYLEEELEEIKGQIEYVDGSNIDAEELLRGYSFPLR